MKKSWNIINLALIAAFATHCGLPPKLTQENPGMTSPNTGTGNVQVTPSMPSNPSSPSNPSNPSSPTAQAPSTPSASPLPTPGPVANPVVPLPGATPSAPVAATKLTGNIDELGYYIKAGQLTGWAADKNDPKAILEVKFYFDGDNKSGKLVGSVKADEAGSDGDTDGYHAFTFEVPAAHVDGKVRKVYAYAVIGGVEEVLTAKVPYSLTFYKPKGGAAETAFNKIGFTKAGCGCHGFSYSERYEVLTRPNDAGKWTANANALYTKAIAGHTSKNRPNICGILNCPEIINWWNAEFGP